MTANGTLAVALLIVTQEGALKAYKQYGEGNENAQKVLYDLEEKPAFKAFFLVSC